jgi:hypothetical protein
MSALSRVENTPNGPIAFIVASPIFPVGAPDYRPGTIFEFEVLNLDGGGLHRLLNHAEYYAIGSEIGFWGRLISLTPSVSTHQGLALMRDKPVLRARIEVLPAEIPTEQ